MTHNSLDLYWRGRFCDWLTERSPHKMAGHNLAVVQNRFMKGECVMLDLRNPAQPMVMFPKPKQPKTGDKTTQP